MKFSFALPLSLFCFSTLSSCIDDFSPALDTTAPNLILQGQTVVTIDVFDEYVEQGFTVNDDIDTNVNVTIEGSVNTSVTGVYELSYTATDFAGNQSNLVRTVLVSDQQIPQLTLNGPANLIHSFGQDFIDPFATATDNYDLEIQVTVTGQVFENQLGEYVLTYMAVDSSGNQAQSLSRNVSVIDNIAPVLSLIGEHTTVVEKGDVYTELGANVTDNFDNQVNIEINGSVDTNQTGS